MHSTGTVLLLTLPPPSPLAAAEAQASAQAQGKGQALAQALAQAQAVAQCLAACPTNLPKCEDQPFSQGCCNDPSAVSKGQCGCTGNVCTYKLATATPLVWQNSVISSLQCRCC